MNKLHLLTGVLALLLIAAACTPPAANDRAPLDKTFLNQQNGYSESVSVTTAAGVRTIYVSGQIGSGDDFDTQMRDALRNLESALATAGATLGDIVKMNTYIVDYSPELLNSFRSIRKEVMGDERMPASTLVGVESLALEEWLIEIDAVAVVAIE